MRILFAAILFFAMPAFAQEVVVNDLCGFSPEYQMPVGVEYKAETDAAIAADINPLNAGVPGVINIPITVKLAERFPDLGIPSDLELEPDVGMLSIHQDGRIFYNGQDVSAQVLDNCDTPAGEETGEETTTEVQADPPAQVDGQEADVPVKSEPKLIQLREGIEGEVLDGQYPEKTDTTKTE